MSALLNTKLEAMGLKQKLFLASFVCFLADFLLVFYITKFIKTFITPEMLANIARIQGATSAQVALIDFGATQALLIANARLMLFIVLIYHLIIYILCFLQKKWAIKYVSFYTFTAIIFSAIELALFLTQTRAINPYTLATIVLYFIANRVIYQTRKSLEL